ncbi:Cysteine protease atg4 [Gryganskiella cystojenkinii]|nr:Cysteine protease atg4 [Gryganskiella cystojenkinii]
MDSTRTSDTFDRNQHSVDAFSPGESCSQDPDEFWDQPRPIYKTSVTLRPGSYASTKSKKSDQGERTTRPYAASTSSSASSSSTSLRRGRARTMLELSPIDQQDKHKNDLYQRLKDRGQESTLLDAQNGHNRDNHGEDNDDLEDEDRTEFWSSLYAQHTVLKEQAHPEQNLVSNDKQTLTSPRSEYAIKLLQVLRKFNTPGSRKDQKIPERQDHHSRFEQLPLETATATLPHYSHHHHIQQSTPFNPFSIVFFFTLEASTQKSNDNSGNNSENNSLSKRGGRRRTSDRSLKTPAPPPVPIWLSYSIASSTADEERTVEFLGSFRPNNTQMNESDLSPFYIYESRPLELSNTGSRLNLRLTTNLIDQSSTDGGCVVELSYTFGNKSLSRQPSKITFDDELDGFEKEDDLYHQDAPIRKSSKSKDQKRSKKAIAAAASAVVAQEPDTGEHIVQATSEFFSKMGYWLYNSKVVQLIARDDRVRTRTVFSTKDDIWMLGVCYSFQPAPRSTTTKRRPRRNRSVRSFLESEKTLVRKNSGSLRRKPSLTVKKSQSSELDFGPFDQPARHDQQPHRQDSTAGPEKSGTLTTISRPVTPSQTSGAESASTPDMKDNMRGLQHSQSFSYSNLSKLSPPRSPPTSSVSLHGVQSEPSVSVATAAAQSSLLAHRSSRRSSSQQQQQISRPHSTAGALPTEGRLAEEPEAMQDGSRPGGARSREIKVESSSANSIIELSSSPEFDQRPSSARATSKDHHQPMPTAHKEEKASEPEPVPSPRKITRRRMTITGLFSWDSTKADSQGEDGESQPLPQTESVKALKSIVAGSTKTAKKQNQLQQPTQQQAHVQLYRPPHAERERAVGELSTYQDTQTTPIPTPTPTPTSTSTAPLPRRQRSVPVNTAERFAPANNVSAGTTGDVAIPTDNPVNYRTPPSSWSTTTSGRPSLEIIPESKPPRTHSSDANAVTKIGPSGAVKPGYVKVALSVEREEALSYIRSGMGSPHKGLTSQGHGPEEPQQDQPSRNIPHRGQISQRSRSEGLFMETMLSSSKKSLQSTPVPPTTKQEPFELQPSPRNIELQRGPASFPASSANRHITLTEPVTTAAKNDTGASAAAPKRSWRRSLSLSISSAKSSFPSMGLFSPTVSTPPTPSIPTNISSPSTPLSMSLPRKYLMSSSRSRTSGPLEDPSAGGKLVQEQDLDVDVVSLPPSTSAYLSLLLTPPFAPISAGTSEDDSSTGTTTPVDESSQLNKDSQGNDDSVKKKGTVDVNGALIAAHHFQRQREQQRQTLTRFMMDFQSRPWFTYRKDLARIEPSFYTCDSGWGCMMRTGQSLLAQAFVQVMMGRDWRVHLPPPNQPNTSASDLDEREQRKQRQHLRRYRRMLGWFADEPIATSPKAFYSIHGIAKEGVVLDKRIGEWFGPATVAHALQRLSMKHKDCPLQIVVNMDGCVRFSTLLQAAANPINASSSISSLPTEPLEDGTVVLPWSRPVLLMLPTRFGLDKVTEIYRGNLKRLFRMPQFLGIAGDDLYYYDPHFVKTKVPPEEIALSYPVPSFHCGVVRSMDIQELDPSMLLGFLVRSLEELQDLKRRLEQDMERRSYPLMTLLDDLRPLEEVVKTTGFVIPDQEVVALADDDEFENGKEAVVDEEVVLIRQHLEGHDEAPLAEQCGKLVDTPQQRELQPQPKQTQQNQQEHLQEQEQQTEEVVILGQNADRPCAEEAIAPPTFSATTTETILKDVLSEGNAVINSKMEEEEPENEVEDEVEDEDWEVDAF